MKDVVYEDENYTLGSYYRGNLLAREIAKKHNRLVFLHVESDGGTSTGPIHPDERFWFESK